jgi:hypothetical protein
VDFVRQMAEQRTLAVADRSLVPKPVSVVRPDSVLSHKITVSPTF